MKGYCMTDQPLTTQEQEIFDDAANAAGALRDKLADAQTPGYRAEFDPEEAAIAGAFVEDALSEQEAADSSVDLADTRAPGGQ
jgi:hypothetical protein